MKLSEKPLLDPGLIPLSLWDAASETLQIPSALSLAYYTLIDRHGLRSLAVSRDPNNSPVGGLDQLRTDQHFAQAFDGSVARAQLAILDPLKQVKRASNAFIQSLSGNELCITDAPCGAGAAVFAFLTTIAELRANDVLPRLPLDVSLIGAEISAPARAYFTEILEELRPFLEAQAISVNSNVTEWNLLDRISNADLISRMTRASTPNTKSLLIVANFSGFLEQEKRRAEAEAPLEELFRHASGNGTVVVWIEPQMNHVISSGGLFAGLARWAKEKWHKFMNVNTDGRDSELYLVSKCKFRSPIDPTKTHPVRLAVMRLDLERKI